MSGRKRPQSELSMHGKRYTRRETGMSVLLSARAENVRIEKRYGELFYSPHASEALRRRIESARAPLMELLVEL